jgi:hypothetical protein
MEEKNLSLLVPGFENRIAQSESVMQAYVFLFRFLKKKPASPCQN